MKSEYHTVDEYINNLAHNQRYVLTIIRKIILKCIPNVKETMVYGMPTYKLKKKICAFNAQKDYYNFYIFDDSIMEKYKELFGNSDIVKNSIRFKNIEEISLSTFEKILMELIEKN